MKYRKKPIVIEAIQLTAENLEEIREFCGQAAQSIDMTYYFDKPVIRLHLMTLEGRTTAKEGDYIIKGIKGEVYPCNEEIFAETYDAVVWERA